MKKIIFLFLLFGAVLFAGFPTTPFVYRVNALSEGKKPTWYYDYLLTLRTLQSL